MAERDTEQRELFVAAAELSGTAAPAVTAHHQQRLHGLFTRKSLFGRRCSALGAASPSDVPPRAEPSRAPRRGSCLIAHGPASPTSRHPAPRTHHSVSDVPADLVVSACGLAEEEGELAEAAADAPAGASKASAETSSSARCAALGAGASSDARERLMRATAMLQGQPWGRQSVPRRMSVNVKRFTATIMTSNKPDL